MKIPKYVQELMERSEYDFDYCKNNENYSAGYAVKIKKRSAYQNVGTFREEIERLVKWANKVAGVETAYVLYMPNENHHRNQIAIVSIFDPVMKNIEQYIQQ